MTDQLPSGDTPDPPADEPGEPAAEERAAEEPESEPSAADPMEEPVAEEPVAEEPAAEEPASESAEEPSAPEPGDEPSGEGAVRSRLTGVGDRPLVRAGLRGFLDLTRVDVALVVGLTLLAFVLRFGSPILPNFLGGSAASAPAIQVLGVGSAYNSDSSACEQVPIGNKTIKACGQVFDEVYFPTDAADDLHSPAISYFDPEPPLVKLLMTSSIQFLGFDTMGWRMTQVVTGSLLCGLMYLIALRLRRDRFFAIVASLLVCLDGLAFVESRLGLIDIPAIFFTALAWYLFLLHWQARTRRQWRITLYVMAAGLGLAFAAKLTALAPLVVIATLVLFRGIAPYAAAEFPALRRLAGPRRRETVLWREAAGSRAWVHYAAGMLLVVAIFCGSFSRYLTISHDDVYQFVSCNPNVSGLTTAPPPNDVRYLPVPVTTVGGVTLPNPVQAISNIIAINEASLRYQELECHGHPYASRWYTWPITEHPVLMYYQNAPLLDAPSYSATGVITNMGNPAIWWLGILALLFCVWRMMAGPKRLRVAVGALMVVSLTTMIITFHAAEPGIDPVTGTQPGPIGAVSPLFYVALVGGMGLFCVCAAVFAVVSRRFVPAFIVLGYVTSWMMWVPGNKARVLFFYHALGMLIFLALACAYALTSLRNVRFFARGRWWSLAPLAYAGVAVVVAAFIFFYPIWTAIPLTAPDQQMRLWVDAW
ncbi:MAG: phospholipid carrier-dependent glycosyltransferase [Candidatus Dormibacteria bacterium]